MQNEQNQNLNNPNLASQGEALQNQPPVKPKKAFKKWLIIGILVILILSLPLGGYLLLGKLGIQPKPSTVTITTPSPSPDPTANWKTYNGSNFSFKIPSDVTVIDNSPNPNDDMNNPWFYRSTNNPIRLKLNSNSFSGGFLIYNTTDELKLKAGGWNGTSETTNKIINGITFYSFIVDPPTGSKVKYILVNGKAVEIMYQNGDLTIIENILSTFKFTDQTSPTPTTTEKTFLKIPEYGVQVVLNDEIKDAYYINTTAAKGYVYLKVHSLDSEAQCKKDDSSTAALSRVGKDEVNQMSDKKYSDSYKGVTFGHYFYYIDLAQYICAESPAGKAKLEKVRTAFSNAEITQ